ncbi:phenylalanine--tRNA ligase subunit alpha [Candidatus Daviesbacteria bacterium]|nr:phenylalanine--tRNA ligase subunit alpha [Candidatus Daviesbacteria bacterium]
METQLDILKKKFLLEIENSQSLKELDGLFLQMFGKSGEITLFPKNFSKLEKSELKIISPLFNQTKKTLAEAVRKRRGEVKLADFKKILQEPLGLRKISTDSLEKIKTKKRQGHTHIITQFEEEIIRAFSKLGFAQFDAPQIDSDTYNFELLNIPQDHPARDLWDTLYIETSEEGRVKSEEGENLNPGKLLLRTHTSNAQVRIMEKIKPPFRQMILGRCYRYENTDARHEHTFEQFEIVYVDKGLSMANLLYLSEYFFQAIFGYDVKARLKPKYYPFVEPGAGVDGLCIFCKGKGCKVCGGVGWLELAGAGMIHPTVLKNGGIDPDVYSGIAWGFGLGRMLMVREGIKDVRLFNSGDLRFLNKY